jgi:sugar/nucleoside kinase (ribokinase family)
MLAVVAGYFCLDIAPNLDHIPEGQFLNLLKPGRLLQVGDAKFAGGGAVSNTGLTLHRLGIPTYLMAQIGADPFGRALCEIIAEQDQNLLEGIHTSENGATSYTLIFDPPGLDRSFINFSGPNDTFCAADLDYDVIARAQLFHFGYPTAMRQFYINDGMELERLYERVKACGATTSLDTSFPDPTKTGISWKSILQRALPHVDIFQPSIEEILFIMQPDTFQSIIESSGDIIAAVTPSLLSDLSAELLEMGVKLVLIKLGKRGAYLRTAGERQLEEMGRATLKDTAAWSNLELWTSSFQVNVGGTTGSGDAAIAGFVSSILRNTSAQQALLMAVAVGACSVSGPDPSSGVLSWEKTWARINLGWQQYPLDLSAYGWQKDPKHLVWARV